MIQLILHLRLLHFLRKIALPGCQVGSSIMPGKVNPVMLEAAMSAAMKVQANDALNERFAAHVEGITANAEVCQRRVGQPADDYRVSAASRLRALLQQFQREPQTRAFREFLTAHISAERLQSGDKVLIAEACSHHVFVPFFH